MSRGGFGAGRGGGAGMLKGATWEHDADIRLESKPSDLFPPHPNLKTPFAITERESRQVKYLMTLQTKIRRGPLYTQPTRRDTDAPAKTFSEDQFNRQHGTNRKADMDPFSAMETYSSRMALKTNDIPKLSELSLNKHLFPKELWPTLEGTESKEGKKGLERVGKKKADFAGISDADKQRAFLARLESFQDEDGEDLDDENPDEVEEDSEFDDEDMGGDYDGEQYFDNGEEGSEYGDGGDDEPGM